MSLRPGKSNTDLLARPKGNVRVAHTKVGHELFSSLARMVRISGHCSTAPGVQVTVPPAYETQGDFLELKDKLEFVDAMAGYLPELRTQIGAPNGLDSIQTENLKAWYTSMEGKGLKSDAMRRIVQHIKDPDYQQRNLIRSERVTREVDMHLTTYFRSDKLHVVFEISRSSIPSDVGLMLSIFDIFLKHKMREHTLTSEESNRGLRNWMFTTPPNMTVEWYQSINQDCKEFLRGFSSGKKKWPQNTDASVFWEPTNTDIQYDLSYKMNALCYPM